MGVASDGTIQHQYYRRYSNGEFVEEKENLIVCLFDGEPDLYCCYKEFTNDAIFELKQDYQEDFQRLPTSIIIFTSYQTAL